MINRLLLSLVIAATASACVRHSEAAEAAPREVALGASGSNGPAARKSTDIQLSPDGGTLASRVASRDTLAALLKAAGVRDDDALAAVERSRDAFDPRKLRAEQPYRVDRAADGALRRFEYEIDGDRMLRVERSDRSARLQSSIVPIEKTRVSATVEGFIDRENPSLFAAMETAGESIELPISLASIFEGEIDFGTELQPGDSFKVVVEKQYRSDADGRSTFAGYGPVTAAEFDNAGRRYRAFRFVTTDGAAGYFDERGVSLKRFFLRSPLKFQPVVTSGFSHSRFHPILKEYRAHLGVDYRAPAGSPVVASADGVVLEAGASGGSGLLVHLRHPNGFETEYLHLSSIAVRTGAHVRQGDLIGRVGATGLATGPHLDYRLKKNGTFINPLVALRLLPPAEPIPSAQMATFAVGRDHGLRELESAADPTARHVAHEP